MEKLYKLVRVAGKVCQEMYRGLTKEDAYAIGDDFGWVDRPDGPGGFEWNIQVEEDDE